MKENDIVVIVGDGADNCTGEKVGFIFQVKEVSGKYLRPTKNRSTGIHSRLCRLATPQEIEAYKSGIDNIEKIDIETVDLVVEAKKRFPIGCTFQNCGEVA